MKRASLHLYASPLTHESRILKETKSLVRAGIVDHCVVVGFWQPGLEERQQVYEHVEFRRIKLFASAGILRRLLRPLALMEWFARVPFVCRDLDVRHLHCHGIFSLPVALYYKLFLRTRVIYDAHELETERKGVSKLVRRILKVWERAFIPCIDSILVVNEHIADWYRSNYRSLQNKVEIILNIPELPASIAGVPAGLLRDKIGVKMSDELYIYQGLLSSGRAVEKVLDAFKLLPPSKNVVFMGYGVLEERVKEAARSHPNIFFHPAVSPDEVLHYTKDADVGLCIVDSDCLSYRFGLSNKFFEYLLCGIPMITSTGTTLGEWIQERDCGWVVDANPEAIARLLRSMDKPEILRKGVASARVSQNFSWANEEKKLFRGYGALVPAT